MFHSPKDSRSYSVGDTSQCSKSDFPYQKLSALTRKKNEVYELLEVISAENCELVKLGYNEYSARLNNYVTACNELLSKDDFSKKAELKAWLDENLCNQKGFQLSVQKYFFSYDKQCKESHKQNDDIRPEDSVSNTGDNRSSFSHHSSSVSSARRIALAEQKAKLSAEVKLAEEKAKLEQEMQMKELAQKEQKEREDMERQKEDMLKEKAERRRQEELRLEYKKKLKELELQSKIEEQRILEEEYDQMSIARSAKGSKISSIASKNRVSNSVFNDKESCASEKSDQLVEVLKKQNEISLMMIRAQEKTLLPVRDIEKYDGKDITKYKSFIESFKRVIETKCDSDADRLYYLQQYTAAGPRRLVESCNRQDASTGYKRAKELLDKEYGNEYKIASTYFEKIKNWDSIKSEDGEALKNYSLFLLECSNYMGTMTSMNQLNSPSKIKNVVSKLLFEFKRRWRDKFYDLISANGTVKFQDIVNFIEIQAEKWTQTFFGNLVQLNTEKKKSNIRKIQKSPLHYHQRVRNRANYKLKGLEVVHFAKRKIIRYRTANNSKKKVTKKKRNLLKVLICALVV